MYFFTADEHFGHTNIIRYCNRPFENVKEMDEEIIKRHNSVVTDKDIVIHAGDFTMSSHDSAIRRIHRLNGQHIFLKGSHDRWIRDDPEFIWEKTIGKLHIVVCHYPMRTWPRSHYGSIQLHGHSHGKLSPIPRQYDIGVDVWSFYPVSLSTIENIIKSEALVETITTEPPELKRAFMSGLDIKCLKDKNDVITPDR